MLNKEKSENSKLFEVQAQLTQDMRYILLDWINQVSSDYCLKRPTFHKAIHMIDAYLLNCNREVPVADF